MDNGTSLVEGMVIGPRPHYKCPLTVPLVFGRLIDPIGKQQLDLHKFFISRGCLAIAFVVQQVLDLCNPFNSVRFYLLCIGFPYMTLQLGRLV